MPSLRRSSRERKSTVVYVGQDAVKKENNYEVRGMQYRYGTFTNAVPKGGRKKRPSSTLSHDTWQLEKERLDMMTPESLRKQPGSVLNARVAQYFFDGELYYGTVQSFHEADHSVEKYRNVDHDDNEEFIWHVLYDDGDEADWNAKELLGMLKLYIDKSEPPTKQRRGRPKQRKLSHVEQLRAQHRHARQQNVERRATARSAFLRHHSKQLRPFLEDKVAAKILGHQGETKTSNKNTVMTPAPIRMQPDSLQGDMRDYQMQGLEWMSHMHANGMGMILGDEMGLGKTLQTIALVCHLKEQHEREQEGNDQDKTNPLSPNLVVCPLSVLQSWRDEVKKWAPSLKCVMVHTSDSGYWDQDKRDQVVAARPDIVLTTYEMIKASGLSSLWQRESFQLIVLDEGHRIKSTATQIAQAVQKMHSETRIILTGTPVANNLVELYALLHFLNPDVFASPKPFEDAFNLNASYNAQTKTQTVKIDPFKLQQAHHMVNVFMLRRLKDQVEKLMPKKVETKICCPLSSIQIFWYKAFLMKDIKLLASQENRNQIGSTRAKLLSNLIMQLRKVCLHPYLFPEAESDIDSTTVENLIGASGKLAVLDKLLCSLYKKKHRVVLFSQFTSMLDILDDYASMRGWNYCRFDGGTSRAKRNFVIRSFNEPDSDRFLFLMSTRSGGMGLNLQTADTCILYDSDWNPQPDIQAMARIHRLGQTKTVHVYRLVTEGTVEQRMVERAQKKLYLDRMVTRDGAAGDSQNNSTEDFEQDGDKLLATLKFGCNAVFGKNEKSNHLPNDEDIEVITDRSRTEDCSKGKLKGGTIETAKDFDALKGFRSTTEFAGIDFGEIRRQNTNKQHETINEIGKAWQRERKSRIKMMNGEGSGYGKMVPVLAANDYELQTGEKSVFQREYNGNAEIAAAAAVPQKKLGHSFEMQDFCQVCGDGGSLIGCPRCPIALHLNRKCAGVQNAKELMFCTHHNCAECGKNTSHAGGWLYRCNACPNAYCEDHLPPTARIINTNERMEKMNYFVHNGIYIHCDKECEDWAADELKFKRATKASTSRSCPAHCCAKCPPPLSLGGNFGQVADDSQPAAKDASLQPLPRKRAAAPGPTRFVSDSPSSEQSSDKDDHFTPNSASSSDDDGDEVVEVRSGRRVADSLAS